MRILLDSPRTSRIRNRDPTLVEFIRYLRLDLQVLFLVGVKIHILNYWSLIIVTAGVSLREHITIVLLHINFSVARSKICRIQETMSRSRRPIYTHIKKKRRKNSFGNFTTSYRARLRKCASLISQKVTYRNGRFLIRVAPVSEAAYHSAINISVLVSPYNYYETRVTRPSGALPSPLDTRRISSRSRTRTCTLWLEGTE